MPGASLGAYFNEGPQGWKHVIRIRTKGRKHSGMGSLEKGVGNITR